jgi:hypothetical protein
VTEPDGKLPLQEKALLVLSEAKRLVQECAPLCQVLRQRVSEARLHTQALAEMHRETEVLRRKLDQSL